ncbi:MAG TPA: ATP-dependent DNA helicase [Candidatus Paceibacterota bacterium]|jgi:DNA helicase-2/ATP-dependent DNA helicase PcrA|nr:ATP-dependent DNA helicase [Candidatus Paceibacterota bacterium]
MSAQDTFLAAYNALNTEQKRAVDAIEGPVMVIAGPGTGKTQVLAVRIANILTKTDTSPDGILCLTFTNAGVKAMRERLMRLIGPTASRVRIATFHSFALDQIEQHYGVLGFDEKPTLLEGPSSIILFDELLQSRQWQYLRPRANKALYVHDLQSLISNLKRENISAAQFRSSVAEEIERVKNDPDSISSRGESKGQFKKETEKKIESLERSLEAADFYEAYEDIKNERSLIDYSDALNLLVQIVEQSDDARDTIREQFLYVLVDEHQDSSGVQNQFLEAVWKDSERPNIFVVGDDRQLIYGFGGASIGYFENFTHAFGRAERITLTRNYRSTQIILDAAEQLLQSQLAEGKLIGDDTVSHPLRLVETDYPRDEIIAAGLSFKAKVEDEETIYDNCVVLVPKNRQVKAAMQVLRDMGLPVAAATSLQLFELPDTQALLTVLRVIAAPVDTISLSHSILDPIAGIDALTAHQFLMNKDIKKLSIKSLLEDADASIQQWGEKLQSWLSLSQKHDAYHMIQLIADECLLSTATEDETVRRRVEIIRTLLHIALMQSERGEKVDVASFVSFIDRLQEYGQDIPLAVFGADKGIKVLTLHGSKGLEFDAVWIAHMDERSLMSAKRQMFTLPEAIEEKIVQHDEDVKKRELYVAITRAKRFCTISWSRHNYNGTDQQLANIIMELPEQLFEKETTSQSEEAILKEDERLYVTAAPLIENEDLTEIVAREYEKHKVSVTMLNNFFECPWKWYFRNLLQLPEPVNDSLNIGNIVHKNIEGILKGTITDLKKSVEECALIQARYDEVDAKRFAIQALPIIEAWNVNYLPNITKPFSTEKNLPFIDADFPNLSLFGKIDLVEEIISEEVRVTDWKTGSPKTSNEIEKRDEEGRMSGLLRQLAMYTYLINGVSRGDTTVSESRLIFLEAKRGDKNAIHSRHIGSEELELLHKDISDYNESVKNGTWLNRPCNAKTYGSESECEYCTMAKRYGIKAN